MECLDVSAPRVNLLLCLALTGCFIPLWVGECVGGNVAVPAANTHHCPACFWALAFVMMLFPWWPEFQHKLAATLDPANVRHHYELVFSFCMLRIVWICFLHPEPFLWPKCVRAGVRAVGFPFPFFSLFFPFFSPFLFFLSFPFSLFFPFFFFPFFFPPLLSIIYLFIFII